MGTTADKLNAILNTKEAIKQAIRDKGVYIGDHDAFAEYPDAIRSIETSSSEGGSDDFFNLRTQNGTNMGFLFYVYQSEELDVSNLDTSNAETMQGMFCECYNLTTLNLSNFDTSNVTDMRDMFYCCNNLIELDLSNFNMNNVDLENSGNDYILGECSVLQKLRLDNCDNVTIDKIINSPGFPIDTIYDENGNGISRKIYARIENTEGLGAPENWKFIYHIVDGADYIVGIYRNNDEITEADTLVTSEHTELYTMFAGCINLTTVHNMENWDTSNVTIMAGMFQNCKNLISLDLSNFNTNNVTSMSNMFCGCNNLITLDLSSFNTSNVTNMREMFYDCTKLTALNISNFDMTNITAPRGMFGNCNALHTIRLDNCNNDTINKIINSMKFPTDAIDGVQRKIYVQEANITGLTAPTNWIFVDLDGNEIVQGEE